VDSMNSGLFEGLLYISVVAGLISACGIMLFLYIGRMLSRRLTGDLDVLKGELSKKLEVHRLMHQYRADAIDKLYVLLAKAARETALIVDYHKAPPDQHRQFKLQALVTVFHQIADQVSENRIYFPDATVSRLNTFLTDLRVAIDGTRPSLITQYSTALHTPGQSERWGQINYDLTLLIKEIENLARGIIGLDPRGEPELKLGGALGTTAPQAAQQPLP
jgi:hypothetical protein